MPRLHKYVDRDACYALTSIRGAVVTFQLTTEGEHKLIKAGIAYGQSFHRALLLDLYRTGDAFTHGGVVDGSTQTGQLEMDFANDPDPETAFPACDDCPSVNDLHLTITTSGQTSTAKLNCAPCRASASDPLDTSIPVSLLNRPLLLRLFQLKPVAGKATNVSRFEELLHAEFESRWDDIRKQLGALQASLFRPGDTGGLGLD
jgi:hypothetical protein